MPTLKDIKAKNAQFAATARENAGKPRIRSTQDDGSEVKRGRTNVKPSRYDRLQQKPVGGALRNNKLALGLIVFVVCGGGELQLGENESKKEKDDKLTLRLG